MVPDCQQALERLLLLSQGQPVQRCLIDYPYTEEEITLPEEEVPAMKLFPQLVAKLHTGLEATQTRCSAAPG